MWGWLISRFWSRYRIRLRYQWPCIHRRFLLINGLITWRCMVQRRCRRLLVMGQLRKFPWFCLDILLWLWISTRFPYQNRFLLPMSGWFRNLKGNHILQLLFWQHRVLNQLIQLLRCSVLLPNCFRLRFIRRRSYQVWIIDRMVRL